MSRSILGSWCSQNPKGILTKVLASTVASTSVMVGIVLAGVTQPSNLEITDGFGQSILSYERSYALLVGVSDYQAGWNSLDFVGSELQNVRGALERRGFQVITIMDPTIQELRTEVNNFIADYSFDLDNRLLFFFSGHGYTLDRTSGFFVPKDSPDPIVDRRGFLRTALPMEEVLAWARRIQSNHVLFVFDSCFSGSLFSSRANPDPSVIQRTTAGSVRMFITAGNAEEEVPAKSVFTPLFIRGLDGEADLIKDGYVTGEELGLFLKQRLPYYTGGDQSPQWGKIRDPELDLGDIVFRSLDPITPTIAPPVTVSEPEVSRGQPSPTPIALQSTPGVIPTQPVESSVPAGGSLGYVVGRFFSIPTHLERSFLYQQQDPWDMRYVVGQFLDFVGWFWFFSSRLFMMGLIWMGIRSVLSFVRFLFSRRDL